MGEWGTGGGNPLQVVRSFFSFRCEVLSDRIFFYFILFTFIFGCIGSSLLHAGFL